MPRTGAGDVEEALELLFFAPGEEVADLGIEIGFVAANDFAPPLTDDETGIGERFGFDGAKKIGNDDGLPFEALGLVGGEQLKGVAGFLFGGAGEVEAETEFTGEIGERDALRAAVGDAGEEGVEFTVGIFELEFRDGMEPGA